MITQEQIQEAKENMKRLIDDNDHLLLVYRKGYDGNMAICDMAIAEIVGTLEVAKARLIKNL